MKTKFYYSLAGFLILTFFIVSLPNLMAQEKTKKQLKEDEKVKKQQKTKLLVDSKEFIFQPRSVSPQGRRTINLTDASYAMEFRPELIKCYLPFFGRAYAGTAYSTDSGMDFEGKPTTYTIEKTKKSYLIKAKVKGENDTYSITLSVYFEGSAYLTIYSNKRTTISYNGSIKGIAKK